MRLTLASLPAALITLALFLLMQAMVSSPERTPGHATSRSPVAFVSPRDLAGRSGDDGTPAADLPGPTTLPPSPPLPHFAPPAIPQGGTLARSERVRTSIPASRKR